MRKIVVITLIIICFTAVISFSATIDSTEPLTDYKWEGKSAENIIFTSYEDAFIDLYKTTEKYPTTVKSFRAFARMKSIMEMNGLDRKHNQGLISSIELQNILGKILTSIKDPRTEKDYFLRGLFTYPHEIPMQAPMPQLYDNLKYVIDNYPDSIYAKYSYIFLSDNYKNHSGNKIPATELLKKYLEIYNENDELTPFIYYRLADMHFIGITDESGEQMAQVLEYSTKFLTEFPNNRSAGAILRKLGNYYYTYPKDYDKAIEHYLKVFNNSDYYLQDIYESAKMLIKSYKKKSAISEAEALLEKMRKLFSQTKRRDLFNPHLFKELYVKAKLNLEEIKRFGFDSDEHKYVSGRKKYEKIYKEKKDAIEQFRKEWELKYDDQWDSYKIVTRINDVMSIILEFNDNYTNYYSNVSKTKHYFYKNESPLKLKVIFRNGKGVAHIGYSDWYNGLRFSIEPYKHLYSYDETGKMIKEKNYSSENELKKEITKAGKFNVLQMEDLKDGKLTSNEEKSSVVEVFDNSNSPFEPGYYYDIKAGFKLKNGRVPFDWLGKKNNVSFDVIKPITPDQIKDWTIRKGDREVKGKKYNDAVKHYLEVLEKEKENQSIRKILLQKLADTYELDKDYANAKKYLTELLKHVEEEIKAAKDDKELVTKLQEEKKQIHQKMQKLNELSKKQKK